MENEKKNLSPEGLAQYLESVSLALEKQMTLRHAERLEVMEARFIELANKIMRPTNNKIFSLIPKIMEEIGVVGKDKAAPAKAGGYAFRGIDDMYNAIQPALIKHGVFYTPKILKTTRRDRNFSGGAMGVETFVEVEYTFFADDGSKFVAVTNGEAMDTGDKSSNKAMSSALKYCLMEVFCIPTQEAKDSENESYQLEKQRQAQSPPPQQRPATQPQSRPAAAAPARVQRPPVQSPVQQTPPAAARPAPSGPQFEVAPGDFTINFTKGFKGKKVKDVPREDLEGILQWAIDKNFAPDFQANANAWLDILDMQSGVSESARALGIDDSEPLPPFEDYQG